MKKIKFKFYFFSIFHVFFAFRAISNIKNKNWCTKKISGGGGGGEFCLFVEKQFFLISRFMLFSTLKKIYIEKCPFTYWLNGRWLLQIVERDSWNLYPLYPLFPCSDFTTQFSQEWARRKVVVKHSIKSKPLFWFCISNVGVDWGGGGV